MGTRVTVQVLRWTVKNAFVFSPVPFGRCHFQPLCIRRFCSSSTRTNVSLQSEQHSGPRPPGEKPAPELSLQSLLDMGFTDTQAEQIYESVSKVRGGGFSKQALSSLTALFGLGLNPSSVLKVLQRCPEIYTVKEAQLQQRIGHLRKVGFVEGSLQRLVVYYPQILTVPVKTLKNVVLFLREKCLFTVQQVSDILRDSPGIVQEDLAQVEYKFQYVYFRMGVKQAEMVKSKLFRFTLDEVRCRHCFLECRGLYQTPDKKGQTFIINPKLDSILKAAQDTFLTDVAKASEEEYSVFQRLMAREWKEEDLQHCSIEADSDDSEEVEEDDEESGGKSGYRKQRKR
ncbi:hypothetical protein Q5P01_022402 [Channa striata]|uniref:Mitochondrial transcription termination factor 4 n=1 Tax=Channa striata TaxID=64152 RepID=A0AA88J8T9_CHASR|nr:hypothetical protein Q5P01_022402 [Channa striata]